METSGVIAGVAALSLGAINSAQYAFGQHGKKKDLESIHGILHTLISLVSIQDDKIRALEAVLNAGGAQSRQQQPQNHGNGQVINRLSILEGQMSNHDLIIQRLEEDIENLINERAEEPAPPSTVRRVVEKPLPPARSRAASSSSNIPTANPKKRAATRVTRVNQRKANVIVEPPSDNESLYGDDNDDELLAAVSR